MGMRSWMGLIVAWLALAGTLSVSPAGADSLQFSGPMSLDPSANPGSLNSVSCPTADQCTAIDGSGREVTFNPNTVTSNSATAKSLGNTASVTAVSCPST